MGKKPETSLLIKKIILILFVPLFFIASPKNLFNKPSNDELSLFDKLGLFGALFSFSTWSVWAANWESSALSNNNIAPFGIVFDSLFANIVLYAFYHFLFFIPPALGSICVYLFNKSLRERWTVASVLKLSLIAGSSAFMLIGSFLALLISISWLDVKWGISIYQYLIESTFIGFPALVIVLFSYFLAVAYMIGTDGVMRISVFAKSLVAYPLGFIAGLYFVMMAYLSFLDQPSISKWVNQRMAMQFDQLVSETLEVTAGQGQEIVAGHLFERVVPKGLPELLRRGWEDFLQRYKYGVKNVAATSKSNKTNSHTDGKVIVTQGEYGVLYVFETGLYVYKRNFRIKGNFFDSFVINAQRRNKSSAQIVPFNLHIWFNKKYPTKNIREFSLKWPSIYSGQNQPIKIQNNSGVGIFFSEDAGIDNVTIKQSGILFVAHRNNVINSFKKRSYIKIGLPTRSTYYKIDLREALVIDDWDKASHKEKKRFCTVSEGGNRQIIYLDSDGHGNKLSLIPIIVIDWGGPGIVISDSTTPLNTHKYFQTTYPCLDKPNFIFY